MAVNPSEYPYQVFQIDHNDDPDLVPGGGYRGCAADWLEAWIKFLEYIDDHPDQHIELRNVLTDELIDDWNPKEVEKIMEEQGL